MNTQSDISIARPLKWSNLKRNLCPMCGEDLSGAWNKETRLIQCECGFGISQKRMGEIVADKVNKTIIDRYSGEEQEL